MRAALVLLASLCAASAAHAVELPPEVSAAGTLILDPRPACVRVNPSDAANSCQLPEPRGSSDAADQAAFRVCRALLRAYVHAWPTAYEDIAAALGISPEDATVHHAAARFAVTASYDIPERIWFERAAKHIEDALALRPEDPDMLTTLAVIRDREGRSGDALAAYDRALALTPDHGLALVNRAGLLLNAAEPERALFDLNKAAKAGRDLPRLRFLRAQSLVQLARHQEALIDLDALVEKAPTDFTLRLLRIGTNVAAGHTPAALSDLDFVLGEENGTRRFAIGGSILTSLLMRRGMLLMSLGRTTEAAVDYHRSLKSAGKKDILRLQVYLRQNGFPSVPLDGQTSPKLLEGIQSCFADLKCRSGIITKDA